LNAPSSLSAPSTQSAPSSYFATNSPDEAVAAKPAAPLPPDAQPRRRRAGRHAATTPEQPFTQATQAVPALTQPAVTPAAPAAASQQVAQTGAPQPSQQAVQASAPQPSPQPAVPVSPQPPSSPQGPYGAGANSSPVWQPPRNPGVRYDVVPNQSLWQDEEDDDTNPTGVPAI
jgi:cell division protein zipA homolog